MPSPPDANDFTGFLADYFAECDEHLTAIRQLLLSAERGKALTSRDVDELFRSFHSIKGLSGMVELREAELLAHHMESYLRVLRSSGAVASDAVSTLIAGTHALEQVIAARRAGQPPPDITAVVTELEALPGPASLDQPAGEASTTPVQAPRHRWRVVFSPSQALAGQGIGVDSVRALLREAGDIVEAAPRVDVDGQIRFEFVVDGTIEEPDSPRWAEQGLVITRIEAEATVPAPGSSGLASPVGNATLLAPSHFVRVDLARLDDLMRMIGDLVISRARLADTLSKIERRIPPVEWRTVQENSLAIERQLRDLRDGVMRVRLVPVGEIFRRMPFVVRDLAREAGKEVSLIMRGQDTEIDKFLIERMLDPILHLVRNAVSHGIEMPDDRATAGKPRTGTITLSAASVGDLVVIEVSDDGRGVDRVQVAERARSVGLLLPEGPLEGDSLLQVLCAPGFSTRDAPDLASGRGVGMAVVQTTVFELGGRLSLDMEPGQGSRFVLELPLTLAITDAIIARVGQQTFAITQSAVREVIEVSPDAVRPIENNELVPYRGGVLPIVRLARLFRMEARPGRALHVFVVGQGSSAVGLVVDRIVGQREIVVRSLADPLVKVDGVVGATDLGDGRVVLILDAHRLTAAQKERGMRSAV
jgi:two-component system, chemotaxis family, sensor kinase CheA